MNKPTKIALLMLLISIAGLLSMGYYIYKQTTLKQEAIFELNALRTCLSKLQSDCGVEEKAMTQLQDRYNELAKQVESLEVQIAQIEKVRDDTTKRLSAAEKNIELTQNAIRNLEMQRNEIAGEIVSTESAIAKLETNLSTLKQATEALERHLKQMVRTTGVRLEPPKEQSQEKPQSEEKPQKSVKKTFEDIKKAQIKEEQVKDEEFEIEQFQTEKEAVKPEPEVKAPAAIPLPNQGSLEGEVLVVNREFNFIVISLGKQDGVQEGNSFYVYDADKLLGVVRVETVRDNISAASGGKDLDAYQIRSGNKVVRGDV
ncbi:MAG: hypothetical protein V2A72_00320 [Candidatus Omnitrophota bacterium]